MLTFSSPGSLNLNAIRIFGLHAKPNTNSPIGFFGTGLKYAVAIAMRNGYAIDIHINNDGTTQCYSIGSKQQEFRNTNYNQIVLYHPNGHEEILPFTTELGKNWQPWMMLRELWCNTLDEGGHIELISDDEGRAIHLPTNHTIIVLKGADNLYYTRSEWLLHAVKRTLIDENPTLQIYQGNNTAVFYKQIQVHKRSSQPYYFTYNLLGKVQLTEDRTLTYYWDINDRIQSFINVYCTDTDLIETYLTMKDNFAEHSLTWIIEGSDIFNDTLTRIGDHDYSSLTDNAKLAYHKLQYNNDRLPKYDLDQRESIMLRRAMTVLSAVGIPNDFPIVFVESLGTGILGSVRHDEILIAREAFTRGTHDLARTILEEWIHITHKVSDETRAMQEAMLKIIISLAERASNEVL